MNKKPRSLNEGLCTAKGLLEQEVKDNHRCRDDIDNLLSVTEIAALFLDTEMRIRGLTPSSARLLNLKASDTGRMLADVLPSFHDDTILDDAVQGLQKMVVLEKEVVANDGTGYLRRIQPYRTQDNHIDGVVIAFIDVSTLKNLERQLAVTVRHVAAILDVVADGIVRVGPGGIIGEFNPAAKRLFACSARKAFGQPLQRFLKPGPAHAEEESIMQLLDDQAADSPRKLTCEGVRITGECFPIQVRAVRVADFGGYVVLLHDISKRREIGRQIVEYCTLEQQRIGQLIHNGLGQQLTAVDMLASALTKKLENLHRAEAAEARQLEDQLRQAVIDSTTIIRGLSPVGIEPKRLVEALKRLADQVGNTTGVHCTMHCESEILTMDRLVTSHLYRIAQEALDNALQYGAPSHIDIGLRRSHRHMRLCIYDDGEWTDKPEVGPGMLGLHIMAYRASILGGKMTVQRQPDGGRRVLCEIPLLIDPL